MNTPTHPWLHEQVRTVVLTLLGILVGSMPLAALSGQEQVDFNRDIRPILSDKCFFCHGPDPSNREADLRFDDEDAAKEYAIVPGEPDESELMVRITSDDPESRMPPPQSKLVLTPGEIKTLQRWINEGAVWNQHWAFQPPRQPSVPQTKDRDWPQNDIDQFILHRLEANQLQPSPQANRETLIRRLSFDLTGLPPTLSEIDTFLADESPDAYERVVDRLLASERFGERLASEWLDVARYSDTYGYQVDRDRYVWPWRDWVIHAFNQNMKYDEFITQQLAGDLIPEANDDQILATTFNRLHPQKVEGGSTPEEFRIEYVADRTQTFATAFLGMTMECCRCHDHKYDPLSQKEYYQISAFFDNIDEAGLYSYFTESVPTPTLQLADDDAKQKLIKAERDIERAEIALASVRADRHDAFEQWLRSMPSAEVAAPIASLSFEEKPTGSNQLVEGVAGQAIRLTGDDAVKTKVGNFTRYQPFSVALWLNTPDVKERAVVFHRSRAWTDAASRGYELLIEEGRLSASLIHFWPGNAISVKCVEPLPVGQWKHVVITYDGSSQARGLQIYIDGNRSDLETVRDDLYKNITGGGGDHIAIGERFRDRGFTNGLVDEFQVFDRHLSLIEIKQIHDEISLTSSLATASDELSDQQREQLYEYYLATVDDEYRLAFEQVCVSYETRCKIEDGLQEIMVMRELPDKRKTYLLNRGAYDKRSDEVFAETPAVLPAFPEQEPRNRLGLARWLTAPENPLTARVAVNRYWQLIFGNGIVATPEDFGQQGSPPTHPELLDWLAFDFQSHGWDIKRLLKQIVMTATYQQVSTASKELFTRDPENRLLARAPSFRLPAEMLRDNALAISGRLVDRLGGPPAKPYEVELSFKPVDRDKGEGLYRRSLYTYWKRTGPAPSMMTLDAAKRDVCRVKRENTSSPLQAFVLMNDPQFVEAARGLAEKLLLQHGDDQNGDDQKQLLVDMFRTLTSRPPSERELEIMADLYQKQKNYFLDNEGLANDYLQNGDYKPNPKLDPHQLAAISSLVNTLMSFDESVMRH